MREFDIFVKGRIVEADLIVSKIPYRSGITVSDRLVLESLLKELVLYKFIAAQSSTELVASIDNTIKRVFETIGDAVCLEVDADFCEKKRAELESAGVIINAQDMPAVLRKTVGVSDNTLSIICNEVEGDVLVVITPAAGSIVIGSTDVESVKTDYEAVSSCAVVDAIVSEQKRSYESPGGASFELYASAANARVGRYRKLYEMDDYELSEIDNMTLYELDFIEI